MPPSRLTSPTTERETALTRSMPSSSTPRVTVELAPMPPTSTTAASCAGIGHSTSSSAAWAPFAPAAPFEPAAPFAPWAPVPGSAPPVSVVTVWSSVEASDWPSPGMPGNGRSGSPGRPGIGPSSSPPSPPSSAGAASGCPSRQSVEYPARAVVFSAEALVREMLPGKSSLDSEAGPAGWLELTCTG